MVARHAEAHSHSPKLAASPAQPECAIITNVRGGSTTTEGIPINQQGATSTGANTEIRSEEDQHASTVAPVDHEAAVSAS